MSTVTSTDASGAAATGTSGTTLTNTSNNLGEDQFLQLMMDQLKAQDPTSPADPTQYLSELASFSSLEQETQISQSTQTTASEQSTSAALGLLGHTVSYTASDGTTQSGTVSKVDFTSSGPTLTVGSDTGVSLGDILQAS